MKILRNSILLTLVVAIAVFVYVLGFRNEFLDDVVKGNTNGYFYNINRLPESLYSGGIAKPLEEKLLSKNQLSFFRSFHFNNFIFRLPYEHPLFYVSPIVVDNDESFQIGFSFYNRKNQVLLSWQLKNNAYFKKRLNEQKVFNFPSVKESIYKLNLSDFWSDLFVYDISVPSTYLFDLQDYSYKLFIAQLRSFYLNQGAESVKFLKDLNFGIVDLGHDSNNLKVEEVYLYDRDILYSFSLKYRDYDNEAVFLKKMLIEGLKLQDTDQELSKIIFQEFKELSFDDKTSELGMLYLLSAWSHDRNSQEYLKAAVFYLEKGQSNLINLGPLYEYAFKKYGTNFSSLKNRQKKTAEVQLKENIKKEDLQLLEKSLNTENSEVTPTDLIKLKLKKGKESSVSESDKLYLD